MDFQLAKREVFIFMIVGPRGHVHDSQNQLFFTLDTPSYFKTAKKLPNTSRYLLKILECDINVFQKIWNGNIGIFKFNWRSVNMCRLFWLPISKTKSAHLHECWTSLTCPCFPKPIILYFGYTKLFQNNQENTEYVSLSFGNSGMRYQCLSKNMKWEYRNL